MDRKLIEYHSLQWARSILDTAEGIESSPASTRRRLNLLEQATRRYASKTADPRLCRPILFLLGYIASTVYLIEQAQWSASNGRPEAELDRWIVAEWTETGGAQETVRILEKLLAESGTAARDTMDKERALVYGKERSSRL